MPPTPKRGLTMYVRSTPKWMPRVVLSSLSSDSPVSVAYQHVREDPRAPSSINREVPPDVDAIVLKALAKNPLNRYQSAQEMRADALRAVAGRPVMATPVMSEAETLAMSRALGMIESGEIRDSKTVCGLLFAAGFRAGR